MLVTPKRYANLAELMMYANEIGTASHSADDIAEAWRTWVTEGELMWNDAEQYGDQGYHMPEGFLTDFASIPVVFRWLFQPNGAPWQVAAVLHDFLYSSTDMSRYEADLAFYYLCRRVGTSELRSATMYGALRLGGWLAYRSNQAKRRAQGNGWRFIDA